MTSDDAAASPSGKLPLVLVTGVSGAGKTSALKALEDMGFEAIDNVPLSLLGRLVAPQPREGLFHKAEHVHRGTLALKLKHPGINIAGWEFRFPKFIYMIL